MPAWMILFISLALLQVADVICTLRNLRGGAVEVNPVVRVWIDLLGPVGGLVVPKAAITAALWYFRVPEIALALLCVLYGWLAWQNFQIK